MLYGPKWFPGEAVRIALDALATARAFLEREQARTGQMHVAVFLWATYRRYRIKGSNDFIDPGPGLTLSTRLPHSWPDGAIRRQGDIDTLVILPPMR
jgi:hypothetical protein